MTDKLHDWWSMIEKAKKPLPIELLRSLYADDCNFQIEKAMKPLSDQPKFLGMNEVELASEIIAELEHARSKFSTFPDDLLGSVVIMVEEAGEALKLANEMHQMHKGRDYASAKDILDLRKELVQTAAMCMRMILDSECMRVVKNKS